ncbi:MAG: potassium channel family protein [Desulfomonilaceae bacterium]
MLEDTIAGAIGVTLIVVVLCDAFETIVLPRRVDRRLRLARLFLRGTWLVWSKGTAFAHSPQGQEKWLGFFGPLAVILLLAVWGVGLIFGFGLLQWADGSHLSAPGRSVGFLTDLYESGTTFFTLGMGDVTPRGLTAQMLTVLESGIGFAFLALVIGYLPGLNQSFSRREVNVLLLSSRAGAPPTAAEILRRHLDDHEIDGLRELFGDWERWSAEFLEGHLAYPMLAFFRSQHMNQSWLAALTTVLDASALTMLSMEGPCKHQAELTFRMATRAAVDIAELLDPPRQQFPKERLTSDDLACLRMMLAEAGVGVPPGLQMEEELRKLRTMYEPNLENLAAFFRLTVPRWVTRSECEKARMQSRRERPSESAGSSVKIGQRILSVHGQK